MLVSLVEVLEARHDIQNVIHQLMAPDDILEAFSEAGVKDPDLARVALEAAVAALVNIRSVLAIDAELKWRNNLN